MERISVVGMKRKLACLVTALAVATAMLTANVGGASGATSAVVTCSATSKDGLKACNADQLRSFYTSGKALTLPTGNREGFVLLGDFYSTLLEALWGGKSFNGSTVVPRRNIWGLTGHAYWAVAISVIIVEYPGTPSRWYVTRSPGFQGWVRRIVHSDQHNTWIKQLFEQRGGHR